MEPGLTRFFPAKDSAEPCVASKTAIPSPIFPPGAIPIPPTCAAYASEI